MLRISEKKTLHQLQIKNIQMKKMPSCVRWDSFILPTRITRRPVLLFIPVLRSDCQQCLIVLAINSSPWIYHFVQLENIFVGIVLLCSTLLLTHSLEENDSKNLEIGVFCVAFLRGQPVYWIADHKEGCAGLVPDLPCRTQYLTWAAKSICNHRNGITLQKGWSASQTRTKVPGRCPWDGEATRLAVPITPTCTVSVLPYYFSC